MDFNGWYAEGDFMHWNYEVYSGGRPIIYINKEWKTWVELTWLINCSTNHRAEVKDISENKPSRANNYLYIKSCCWDTTFSLFWYLETNF